MCVGYIHSWVFCLTANNDKISATLYHNMNTVICFRKNYLKYLNQNMRLRPHLSHCRAAEAQESQQMCTYSSESSLLAYTKLGCRLILWAYIRTA